MYELASEFKNELIHIISQKRHANKEDVDYIVKVLVCYLKSEDLWPKGKIYLVDLYLEANKTNNKFIRIQKFRTLGDYSLVMSGFFPESISNPSYYIDMGSAAYYEVSMLKNQSELYRRLAFEYLHYVNALNHVSMASRLSGVEQIGLIYQKYIETHSPMLKNKLHALGLLDLNEIMS